MRFFFLFLFIVLLFFWLSFYRNGSISSIESQKNLSISMSLFACSNQCPIIIIIGNNVYAHKFSLQYISFERFYCLFFPVSVHFLHEKHYGNRDFFVVYYYSNINIRNNRMKPNNNLKQIVSWCSQCLLENIYIRNLCLKQQKRRRKRSIRKMNKLVGKYDGKNKIYIKRLTTIYRSGAHTNKQVFRLLHIWAVRRLRRQRQETTCSHY